MLAALVSRVGMGLLLPSVSTSALNGLDLKELSDGSSTISFVRQVGGAYGINIVALMIESGHAKLCCLAVGRIQFRLGVYRRCADLVVDSDSAHGSPAGSGDNLTAQHQRCCLNQSQAGSEDCLKYRT